MAPCDVWISIEAKADVDREEWERVRALAFVYARYSAGGCKARTPQLFWKMPWDKKRVSNFKDIMEQHALIKAKLKKDGS